MGHFFFLDLGSSTVLLKQEYLHFKQVFLETFLDHFIWSMAKRKPHSRKREKEKPHMK